MSFACGTVVLWLLFGLTCVGVDTGLDRALSVAVWVSFWEKEMKKIIAITLSLALGGCASSGANFRPVVDLKGRNQADYEQNLRECQQYALQVAGAADQAATGAIAGALLGTAFAAIAGGGNRNAAAGIGALSGATSGAVAGERDQRTFISRCLAGRGFNVLN